MNIASIKKITLCDIYVVLFALYEYAAMYIRSSLASLGTYFPMLLICIYGLYQAAFNYKTKGYINALIVFVLYLSFYGVIHWMSGARPGGIKPTAFLFGNFLSLAPVFVFYIGTIRGEIDERRMLVYLIVFIILSILRFRYNYVTHDMELEEGFSNVGFTNNAAYLFVSLLPFVFLFDKKPIMQYFVLIVLLYFIMNGMKRGAIFTTIGFLAVFAHYTIGREKVKNSKTKRLIPLLFLVLASYAIYYIVQNYWLNNDYFYYRVNSIEEGDSSGRDFIWKTLWNGFLNNGNVFQMLFGLGADGTVSIVGKHAHNDWLELLTDCGLVGVVVYLVYFYYFIKEAFKYKSQKPEMYFVTSCIVILFLRSLFSMSFMDMYIGISVALGYGLAICQQKNKYSLQ